MTGEVWAVLSVGVVLLGVLLGAVLPMIRALGDRIDKQGDRIDKQSEYLGGRIDALGRDLRSELGGRIDRLAVDLRKLGEQVAKLDTLFSGLPWAKEDPKR